MKSDSCPGERNRLGNAVHHVMRMIAEHARATGELPKPKVINDLLNSDFFLPFANKPHPEMH